jgi:PhnB protein
MVPSLIYPDLVLAVEWFERVFGFRERAEARLTWDGGGMAWLEAGSGLLNIRTPGDNWQQGSTIAAPSLVMKVYVDDVDKHFAQAKRERATILTEPQDEFWGGRIYRALDLQGYEWEMSQRGSDLAPDKWVLPRGVTRGVRK